MVMWVLLLTACVASVGGGLAVLGITERRIADTHLRGVQTRYAAEAAVRLAITAIGTDPGTTSWPQSGGMPPLANGARVMALGAGETVDLDVRTTQLNREAARQWPLGADTPQWRLAGWGVLPGVPESSRRVAIWVADDVMDADGMSGEDRNGMLMIHVEAFGPRGAASAVVVHVVREAVGARAVTWREE